ncbi:MAG: hypothetical protein ACRCXM_02830 [Beijerinckiaceae bacterium]
MKIEPSEPYRWLPASVLSLDCAMDAARNGTQGRLLPLQITKIVFCYK